ncbi:MAG: MarR family winged helix-turn-helix transcriptional regulator [Hyphomicrobiales bacterium]
MTDSPAGTAETREIPALIERLARLLRAEEFDAGLNPAQWEALRYLARCNRFSNSPAAIAAYLGATKGTVSQTVQALERKGLIGKAPRPGEGRSVILHLTGAGHAMLRRDPRRRVGPAAASMTAAGLEALECGLRALLIDRLRRNGLRTFGICSSCRFFIRDHAPGNPDGAHRCGLLHVPLKDSDSARICVEHEPA